MQPRMKRIFVKGDHRTIDQITEHYEVEKKLAAKLRNADKIERMIMYRTLYDELFKRIPHHPQLKKKVNSSARTKAINLHFKLVEKYLSPETTFLELGAGDCNFSFKVANYVKMVYAVDVSKVITKDLQKPSNFELILSDGSSVNIPHSSVDIAYSNQLMEHLHPDDAVAQLRNIHQALVHGGLYICHTPHRFTGPHDHSKYFDEVATGFHLKEYTNIELIHLFKSAGFKEIKSLLYLKGNFIKFPLYPAIILENALNLLPYSWIKPISRTIIFRNILTICLLAKKG